MFSYAIFYQREIMIFVLASKRREVHKKSVRVEVKYSEGKSGGKRQDAGCKKQVARGRLRPSASPRWQSKFSCLPKGAWKISDHCLSSGFKTFIP
jgi:hypothetical protein